MKKTYRLKLQEKTIRYLKKIKKEYGVKLSVGSIQEFDLDYFKIPEASGYYFVYDNIEHIYVSNHQEFKYNHDVVVLHEIGHLLMNRHRYRKYRNQEESFANGFALAKAQELGIDVHPKMVTEMCKYSESFWNRTKLEDHIKNQERKKTKKVKNK
jgi:hypothetical protein